MIPELQRAIDARGYDSPTPIQEQCIPHLLEGRDLLGTAQTGTGKTAAFMLPILQRLRAHRSRPRKSTCRTLVLAPTRELAAQIDDQVKAYGRYMRLSHTVIFGGVNPLRQIKALKRGVDVLVATPGRLLDLMGQKVIRLDEVGIFVLDEVDRMLDMGFIPDIRRVLSAIPEERQTLFFSATLPPKLEDLAHSMVRNPRRVTIEPEKVTVDRIAQKVLFVRKKNKDALLAGLLDDPAIRKALVFTQMKHVANKVVRKLCLAGVKGAAIHGNKTQAARTRALEGFKQGQYRVLVATDVAARGLDVDDITHVINYDLPVEAETYVHRIGRTARAGADGDAISFCSAEDRSYLSAIERMLGEPVPAEMDHAFHSQEALHSRLPPRKAGGHGRSHPNPRDRGPRRGRQGAPSRGKPSQGKPGRYSRKPRSRSA